jgi:5-methylcytosine-specific restriction protein A
MTGRVYDKRRWHRLRRLKLAAVPLCEDCAAIGRAELARAVDHVVPVRLGGEPFPPLSGLMSLCIPCHNAKTARGPEAGAARTTKPRRGCDASGRPLDRSHPWNVAAAAGQGGGGASDDD